MRLFPQEPRAGSELSAGEARRQKKPVLMGLCVLRWDEAAKSPFQ